ncbi:MAG: hypothetical protein PHU80_05735, partial [Kiritimatiellae bacterium]|nr:hypothetical protein [Kiritimatiellia bacterium]
MLGTLLLSAGVLSAYVFFRIVGGKGIRDAAVAAWVSLYAFVFVATEGLSVFFLLTASWIRLVWLGMIGAVISALIIHFKRNGVQKFADYAAQETMVWRRGLNAVRGEFPVAAWAVLTVLALTLIHALLAPNFEPDALTYHLPRAQHWLVNRSIGFYETSIARQNYQPPGFSMVVCHICALTGGDRLLNLVQWGAFVLGAAVVSLIARELGAGVRGQFWAGLLSLTLPASISQSFVAVNDQFAAVPVLVFALALLRIERGGERHAVFAGLAAGLAFLAKWTSLVYVASFGVVLSLRLLCRVFKARGLSGCFRLSAILGAAVLGGALMAGPHVVRNMRMYGDPLSGEPPAMLTNQRLTPMKFAVNAVKHAAQHMAAPLRILNRPLEKVVTRFSGQLLNDSDITYVWTLLDSSFRLVPPLGKSCSSASNPLHFMLFTILGLCWLVRPVRYLRLLSAIFCPVAAGALLYCALFKWQLWAARLQIPLFLLMAAGSAVMLERLESNAKAARLISVLLTVYALTHILLRPTWYMPAFLFGRGSVGSGIVENMTVSDKVRALSRVGRPSSEVRLMAASAPPEVACGYSIFYTSRERQYFGNETYRAMSLPYACLQEVIGLIKSDNSRQLYHTTVGLLLGSDHGKIPPENGRLPFSYELIFWAWAGNLSGQSDLKFEHFGDSDRDVLARRDFGGKPGLLVSDMTRPSVVERLSQSQAVECVLSNRCFAVYGV